LIQMSTIQMSLQGSRLALRRGREAAVVFRHRRFGTTITIYYNRTYRTPTFSQKPDASIHIETAKDIHIFDAKYRLQFDSEYLRQYGSVGPRVDDISTMHRYRDAIVESTAGGYTRVVRTACVLFPWHGTGTYDGHAFERSLDVVGVGGLPFLPGSTGYVAERLARIVEEALEQPPASPPPSASEMMRGLDAAGAVDG